MPIGIDICIQLFYFYIGIDYFGYEIRNEDVNDCISVSFLLHNYTKQRAVFV